MKLSRVAEVCSILGFALGIFPLAQVWLKHANFTGTAALWFLGGFLMLTGGVLQVWAKLRTRRTTAAIAIGPQFDSEMNRLSEYEQFAVGRLMVIGAMTGEQFLDRMHEWGFPTATAAGNQKIIDTFENINRKTTLLTQDPHSRVWSVRPRAPQI